jgi:hypothetical protein
VDGGLSVRDDAVFQGVYDNGVVAASATIDWTRGNYQRMELNATPTVLTFMAPSGPCSVHLFLKQASGGGKTVTWPITIKWPDGTAPILTATGSAVDVVTLVWDGVDYYGMWGPDFR